MNDGLEHHLRRQSDDARRFFWHRLRWRIVETYLRPDGRFTLLDFGAGAGVLGDFLALGHPAAVYRFIEPISSLETSLVARFGPAANLGGVEHFDGVEYVTLLDVIEHVEHDRELLADVVGRCDPGTTLLLTVPASQRLWSAWDVTLGHHRRYERGDLVALLEGLPVEVLEVSWLFPELLPAAWWRARRSRVRRGTATSSAEFPQLPGVLDAALYRAGAVSLRLRRHWRAGTSLFAAARRR